MHVRDQPITLLFLPIMLCCRPQLVLLKFTYYAQEQELLSGYYAIYMQFCMNNSLCVPDNFIKTVLLECINEGVKVYHYALSYDDCSIILPLCLILLMTHYA